jgi:hypothetical protein
MVAITQTQDREIPSLRYQFVLEGAGNPKVFFAFSSSATPRPIKYKKLGACQPLAQNLKTLFTNA